MHKIDDVSTVYIILSLEVKNYNVIVSINHCYIVKLSIYQCQAKECFPEPTNRKRMGHECGYI